MTGIADFFRMARARGVGRVLRQLRDVTLYDLRHGTDTDTWLPLSAYAERPENFAEAVQYQPSWTREVVRAIERAGQHVDLSTAAFVDLGSGQGKVCFIAERFPFREVHGVEFYWPLHEIAVENARKLGSRAVFHCADAATWEPPPGPVVAHGYNPFSAAIWQQALDRLSGIVIYTNPVHEEVFRGREILEARLSSAWENERTVIFRV